MVTPMANALDQLDYTTVDGEKQDHDLVVYSLSTCAFCKKAIEFLKEHGYRFRFTYLDLIGIELKRSAKQELKAAYGDIPVFPVLVVDSKTAVSGFIPDRWAEAIEGNQT